MGDSAVLQEICLTAPEMNSVGTNRKEIEKNYKNYLIPLVIEPTTNQLQSRNFDHCAISY